MKRVAGIDFGTVRIGIAISDPLGQIASPHSVYERRGPDADGKFFQQFVDDEQVGLFVVGLPVHMSGDESEKSGEARAFGSWLKAITDVDIVFLDERYTSQQADEHLAQGSLSRKQKKARRDMIAAQILLAAYLESGGASEPESLDD